MGLNQLKTGYEDYPQAKAILGIDECGYGCGAGSLYATGVILPIDYSNSEVRDSKKLSETKKNKVYSDLCSVDGLIKHTAIVSVEYINEHGMSKAMNKAFSEIIEVLSGQYDLVLIDGCEKRGLNISTPIHTVVKGDDVYQCIASASIISKVERDRYMINESIKYPNYALESNKGYLTAKHIQGLKTHGKTEIHRAQYVKNFITEN